MLQLLKKLFPVLIFPFLFSCSDNNKESIKNEEFELLKTEVFAVHDQIMPDMLTTLPATKDSLNAYITKVPATRADSLKKAFGKLDSVQMGMEKWMKEYDIKKIGEKGTLDERIAYLRMQKAKIISIKTNMHEGINNANNLIMISKSGLFKNKLLQSVPTKMLLPN